MNAQACKHEWVCKGPDEYADCAKCGDEVPWTGLLQEARECIEDLREKLAARSSDPRRSGKPIAGYRVRTTDGLYVIRVGEHLWASEGAALSSRAEAYRLAADWLECGYLPTVVRVTHG